MEIIKATKEYAEQIYMLVQDTIHTVYPFYYPLEVAEFFSGLHSRENIAADIERDCVCALWDGGRLVGTGSIVEDHITRVYVSPSFQGRGYGSVIMDHLEDTVYGAVSLDASLPAVRFYEHRGYRTESHAELKLPGGTVLVYEIMKKVNGSLL